MPNHRKPLILLVEDSDDDEFFFRTALERSGVAADLVHAADGAIALRMLEAARDAEGRRLPSCPDLVFLDLKMPVVSGFEVLAWLRAHSFVPPLEVAVLSGSDRELDIVRAKALGASVFHVKPISAARLREHLLPLAAMERLQSG